MTTRRVVRAAASAAAIVLALHAPSPASAQGTPSAALQSGSAAPGDSVPVTGESWPDGTVVQVQLCGNEALNGSIDCDRAGAVTVGVGGNGLFSVLLPITVPPTPCPCIVLVTSPDLVGPSIRLPIEVSGAPIATPVQDQASVPVFSITRLHVTGGGSLRSFFGLSHDRAVVMTVENLGSASIDALPITIADASRPDRVIASGSLEDLAPGTRAQVRVPFTVASLTRGTTGINVTVDQAGRALASSTSFSTFPWGLLLVLLVGITATAVVWTLRRRRRTRPRVLAPVPEPVDGADAMNLSNGAAEPGAAEVTGSVDSAGEPDAEGSLLARERDLQEDLAQRIALTLREVGPIPPASDTDLLAQRLAKVIVSDLRGRHDLDPDAADLLTASISGELARTLRQLTGTPT